MAVEPRRGCGFRKVGGKYLVGGKLAAPCCKLPVALDICPTCAGGVKQSRGWQWIDPRPWLKGECTERRVLACAAADPEKLGEHVGLLWIGTQFYPTPDHFQHEASTLGVSRRITAVPRKFQVGRDWVFLAHPKTLIDGLRKPGVFALFRPTHIELIVTQTQSENVEEMEALQKRGITPVIVPDDDPDHRGTVYDHERDEVADNALSGSPA